MRMWMVNPKIMCRQHLLGEHNEIHMIVGSINKKKSLRGFIDKGLIELNVLQNRHMRLAVEMEKRGYNHQSPLPTTDLRYLPDEDIYSKVNKEKSLQDLTSRCEECRIKAVELGEIQ